MRRDISKVICERQRIGSKERSQKTHLKVNSNYNLDEFDDYDLGSNRASSARRMQDAHNHKVHHKKLNENLSPLKRFLQKSVGKVWNDVYSEIRQSIDPRKAIGFHVLQHVGWYVETAIEMVDSIPFNSRYLRYEYTGLYVNPETGILCYNEKKKYTPYKPDVETLHWHGNVWFRREPLKKKSVVCGCVHFKRVLSGFSEKFICVHGNDPTPRFVWYAVEYGYHSPDEVYRVVTRGECVAKIYYRDVPHEMKKPFAISKKSLNKKELSILDRKLKKETE